MKQMKLTLCACMAGFALLAGLLLWLNEPAAAERIDDPELAGSILAYPPPVESTPAPRPTINVVAEAFLPIVAGNPPTPEYDMMKFMADDGGVLYEVRHSSGAQARHQTQYSEARFFHTKGNEIKAEWEELWGTDETIYRGTDTSPGNGQYYTLYEDNIAGSAWSPRYWREGDLFERNPYVVFYRKTDCSVVASGYQKSWLRFEAHYPSYTFDSGLALNEVIELTWLLQPDGEPVESYFYAAGFGLVGWGSADHGYSYVNEIHARGQRPDNKRESINCLRGLGNYLFHSAELNDGPLPPGFRAK